MSKKIWDKIWQTTDFDLNQDKKKLRDEENTVRWKKIEKVVKKNFRTFKNLEVIELGCGLGDISLIMKLKKANVTLVDYSQDALDKAKIRFKAHNVMAKFIQADIFDLPKELNNKFDLAMSFGVAEHFKGVQRKKVIKGHQIVLCNNGLTMISVPNKYCLPYRLWKRKMQKNNTWNYGLEIPYTRKELLKLSKELKFKSARIFGGSLISDIDNFLLNNKLRKILKNSEIGFIWDNYLAYPIILMAKK